MPSLGADMEHGKLVEWLVKPGDYVRRGDLVAVVDTDKTVMEVESFQEGVVADLLVGIGETVPVGTPLAVITQTPAEVGAPVRRGAPRAGAVESHAVTPRVPEAPGPTVGPPIAPPVRHLAHRLGVDTGKHPRHRQRRRHHPRGRGTRGGGPDRWSKQGAFLTAGPAARGGARDRAFDRDRHRSGRCR